MSNVPSFRVRPTVGIDLGTTNSVIATLDDSGSLLLTGHDEQGRVILPSVVGWSSQLGSLVAGREALNADSPEDVLPLASVKRHMGLNTRFTVGPSSHSPQDISAVILRQLRRRLQRTLPTNVLVDRAIITMPAYFNHNQIEATRQAGELAGFEVAELLHEPTAAAIYYSWLHHHGDATYLVYDLGGGTFDVSIIRRRLDDYEVLAVSGDPFLGGDDFDRLLASRLIESGTWKRGGELFNPASHFDPTQPEGVVPFAKLVRLAEQIKHELTLKDTVERAVPGILTLGDSSELSLEVTVTRATFDRLIREKVARTIDCCHEAVARAKERAGIGLGDIDHVILVGGSSRVPLIRQVVQSAFANFDLPEHVRSSELLLHEPDLCVAYGAALRAAGHGKRYLIPLQPGYEGEIELHLASPGNTSDTTYHATGVVRHHRSTAEEREQFSPLLEGASIRIRLPSGLVEEVFLDGDGGFSQPMDLVPEAENPLEWTLLDIDGRPRGQINTVVRHQPQGRSLGQGVLPTQIITRPLAIEVLTRSRQKVRQIVAPLGATLPGVFRCTCRTTDQSSRIVLPIYEDSRVIKQLVISGLDAQLPVGSPVEVEFSIDVKHTIEVRVCIKGGEYSPDRTETATIEPPPPPGRPTHAEIEEVMTKLEALLEQMTGRHRSRVRTRADQIRKDLLEALSYDDEPRAIQRMAELRDLHARAEQTRGQMLDPPWPRFEQLVRNCLDLAAEVAKQTGRDQDELFEHIHSQQRYAEEAHEDLKQTLYRECWDNLERYAGYLNQLLRDALPRPPVRPTRSPEEEAKAELDHFRTQLSSVWKQVKVQNRSDLDGKMAGIARMASGLGQKVKTEPVVVVRELRALLVEIDKVHQQIQKHPIKPGSDTDGLLEGSS